MFSDKVIALLFTVGASAWIYSKVYRSSGGNTKNAMVVAGGLGLLMYITILVILGIIF